MSAAIFPIHGGRLDSNLELNGFGLTQDGVALNFGLLSNANITTIGALTTTSFGRALLEKTGGNILTYIGAAGTASPAFTGNPTAPTQSAGDNSTKLATTAYADASVSASLNTKLTKASNLSDLTNVTTARTNLGATTVGAALFTLTNPGAITFLKVAADNSVSAESAATHRTSLGATTVGGGIFTLTNPSTISFIKIAADNSVSTRTASQVRTDLLLVPGTNVVAVNTTSNTIFVDAAGNDTTGTRGRIDLPFLTISGALAASGLASGDIIRVGPGTFTENAGIQLPSGVSLAGAGMGVTIIQSNMDTAATNKVILSPGNNSVISDLTVSGSSASASMPFGAYTSNTAATNVTCYRCKFAGISDGVYFNQTGVGSNYLYDCVITSQYDCTFFNTDVTSVMELYNCTLIASGGGTTVRGIFNNGGIIRMYGGSITVSGGSVATHCISSAGTTTEVHHVRLKRTAGGTSYDLHRSGGTLSVNKVVRDDGVALTTNGTITYLSPTLNSSAVTFANAISSPVEGTIQAFTDSSTATWGATITGGGANHVLGYYNGTNWTVMGK